MYTIEETYLDQEVQRILALLGDTVHLDHYDYDYLAQRARYISVQVETVVGWWTAHFGRGEPGLRPDWGEIPESDWQIALERRAKMGDHVDDEVLTDEVIDQIRLALGLSVTQTNRYIARYRVGGIWGMARGKDPTHRNTHESTPPPDLGALSEKELKHIFEWWTIIEPLAMKGECTNEEVRMRAAECGKSPRTLWYKLSNFRNWGWAGLARKERADKGGLHKVDAQMQDLIVAIRLTYKDASPRKVYKEACKRAKALGLLSPSIGQVRDVINGIPQNVLLLADGRIGEYRNKGRLTKGINFADIGMVYQMDSTPIPRLVHDLRDPRYANKSGVVRPWLTAVIECASSVIVAWIITYDPPDRFVVAAVLRQAFLVTPSKPFGGVPDQVWVDTGKYFVAGHVKRILRKADVTLEPHKHHPELEGRIERHFKTAETQCWSEGESYTGPNVVDRNPTVKPHGTIAELAEEYREYLATEYHVQEHSALGESPASFWHRNVFTQGMEPRELDILLKMVLKRKVIKTGIKYGSRQYWHPLLGSIVGEDVRLRIEPSYAAPDEVEVFHDGEWLCTAYADDTEQYDQVSRAVVVEAQRQQVQDIQGQIRDKRDLLKEIDKSIGKSELPPKLPAIQSLQVESIESHPRDEDTEDAPDLYSYYEDVEVTYND